MKIAFKNSKILMINGRTLTPVRGQGPEPEPVIHHVYTSSEGHGSISASPMSGKKNTLITLSNTPDQYYIFSKYTLNNVDLAGSSFLMPDEDAYVRGYFQPDVRTITVTQPSHGTITAPASAQIGSTVTLSCTPDSGYALNYFTVNGTQIQGNTFVMPASNVTVSASLVSTAPVFDQVTIGNQTWMAKNLAIDDGGEGIYAYTANYGQGDVQEHYYTYDAAMRIAASVPGWHLPSKDEWNTLINRVGNMASSLKSTYGWLSGNGTDDYGFAAFPGGQLSSPTGDPYNFGQIAYFWTSTPSNSTWSYFYNIYTSILSNYGSNSTLMSVRLIKDS